MHAPSNLIGCHSDSGNLADLLRLCDDEVHVWRFSLHADAGALDGISRVLAEDEQAKAARFQFERHRRRFMVRRATVRTILGAYLGIPPAEVMFENSLKGKPRLAGKGTLEFNVTDSADLSLIALTRGRRLGIDLEHVRDANFEGIAKRFFTPEEAQELAALPVAARPAGFYRCWTAKEAYLKAIGTGLRTPLNTVRVPVAPDLPATLDVVHDHDGCDGDWAVYRLDAGTEYVATVVVDGSVDRIECREWHGVPAGDILQ